MRWLIRLGLIVWLLMVVLLIAALLIGRVSGNGEMIAFQSSSDTDADIYLYDVLTGVTHNLTRQQGRTLAQVLLSDTDPPEYTNQRQQVISQGSNLSPVWSPDGRRLAFVYLHDGNSEIYLLDLHTGDLRNLTNYPGADSSPVWSPDGAVIAFESLRDGYWGIWLADLEAGTVRALTEGGYASQSPAWSPDSRRIVFQAKPGRYWDLYMIDLGTGETRNLTRSASDDRNPAWAVARP